VFRFSIRDVLWLPVVVGLGIAWWIDRQTHSSEVSRLNDELKQHKLALQWLETYGEPLPRGWNLKNVLDQF
jgi:hypothetical protein